MTRAVDCSCFAIVLYLVDRGHLLPRARSVVRSFPLGRDVPLKYAVSIYFHIARNHLLFYSIEVFLAALISFIR